MPEGDTIHRAAASLHAVLAGRPLVELELSRASGSARRPEAGASIGSVDARGKHLLISFDGGTTLHTHLGMDGSWRISDAEARTRPMRGRPGTWARITTARAVAVCRSAAAVELLDANAVRRHPVLSALGPDLCLPEPHLDEVVSRARSLLDRSTPVGVALLDQRPASGIGNVYRSEVLWACRVDPFAPLGYLDDATIRQLYAEANRLLRANLGAHPRRTFDDGLAVYDRTGRPCPRCRTPVSARRLGDHARTTWWCPTCQTSAP